jgi:hypothetical protein
LGAERGPLARIAVVAEKRAFVALSRHPSVRSLVNEGKNGTWLEPFVRDAEVDERRRDAAVAKPILHVADVPVRVRQMHAYRVPQVEKKPILNRERRVSLVGGDGPPRLRTLDTPQDSARARREGGDGVYTT